MPRLRLLLPACAAALACGACQSLSSGDYAEGDALFRRQDYLAAWQKYEDSGDPQRDPVLAARIARARWFLLEDGVRQMLAQQRPQRALDVLPRIAGMAPPDRAPELQVLQQRAWRLLGEQHARLGYELLEDGQVAEALRELTLAVSWDPSDETSAGLLAKTGARLEREGRLGEVFYFEGMEHVRQGHELRARTSFHHAAGLLGDESRAQQRYEALTEDLAAASRAEAKMFLDAGLLGPAFLSIRTAERLEPEAAATKELAEKLDAKVRSERALQGADLAIRGGRSEVAAEYLAEIESYAVAAHAQEARALAERNAELALDQDYKLARAYELDEQVQRAAGIYRDIGKRTQGFSFADSALRLANLDRRISQAAASYAAALEAEAAEDRAAYRARLEETVRFASDYEDALVRLARERAAELKQPE